MTRLLVPTLTEPKETNIASLRTTNHGRGKIICLLYDNVSFRDFLLQKTGQSKHRYVLKPFELNRCPAREEDLLQAMKV